MLELLVLDMSVSDKALRVARPMRDVLQTHSLRDGDTHLIEHGTAQICGYGSEYSSNRTGKGGSAYFRGGTMSYAA